MAGKSKIRLDLLRKVRGIAPSSNCGRLLSYGCTCGCPRLAIAVSEYRKAGWRWYSEALSLARPLSDRIGAGFLTHQCLSRVGRAVPTRTDLLLGRIWPGEAIDRLSIRRKILSEPVRETGVLWGELASSGTNE